MQGGSAIGREGIQAWPKAPGGIGCAVTSTEVGRTGGHVLARQTFKSELPSLPAIRDFVETWAAEIGLTQEQVFRIKLAVSEACANAVEHPRDKSDLTLLVWNREDRFTVDVWHAGEFEVKTGQERRHRGMGLPLMVASADEVSFACLPEGGIRVSLSVFLGSSTTPR
jgi:anti-sigma regulatory factor (Ser/Thr protein kinase)